MKYINPKHFVMHSAIPMIQFTENMNPASWSVQARSGMKRLVTIPKWLGGAWTARYVITHAWTRWLILWPIMKLSDMADEEPK